MTVPRAFLCLWLLAGLVACDSDQPEQSRQPPAATEVAPAPAPEPAASKPAEPAAPAAEVAPAVPEQSPPVAPRPAAPSSPPASPRSVAPVAPPVPVEPGAPAEPEAPTKPLDLSLPSEVSERFRLPADDASLAFDGEEQPPALLPPLFEEHKLEQSSFELGGRLITNEHPQGEEEGYLDAVEGAELQLRFRR